MVRTKDTNIIYIIIYNVKTTLYYHILFLPDNTTRILETFIKHILQQHLVKTLKEKIPHTYVSAVAPPHTSLPNAERIVERKWSKL